MRLRPANIRLINRRKSYLDRYSLYLRNANNPCNPTSKSTARINKKGLTVHSISENCWGCIRPALRRAGRWLRYCRGFRLGVEFVDLLAVALFDDAAFELESGSQRSIVEGELVGHQQHSL